MFKGSSEPNLNMFSNNLSPGCGDINWSKLEKSEDMAKDNLLLQSSLIPARKRARNIGSKSKRLVIDSVDVLELRLTWEEAQELLRPPPSAKPSIFTVEDHDFEEYDVSYCLILQRSRTFALYFLKSCTCSYAGTTSFWEEDRFCVTSDRVRPRVLCNDRIRRIKHTWNDQRIEVMNMWLFGSDM